MSEEEKVVDMNNVKPSSAEEIYAVAAKLADGMLRQFDAFMKMIGENVDPESDLYQKAKTSHFRAGFYLTNVMQDVGDMAAATKQATTKGE